MTSVSSSRAHFSRPRPSPTHTISIRISPRKSAPASLPSTSRPRCVRSSTATTASSRSPTRTPGKWCARSPKGPARPTTRRPSRRKQSARPRRWQRSSKSRRCRSSSSLRGMRAMDVSTPLKPVADDVDRALVIRNLRKEYRPGQPVLKDVSLTVAGRGMTAIIGPSGTGKSTLVRCINRLVDPNAGEIHFHGHDMVRLRGRELRLARRRMGMVFQEYNLVERLSVIENVLCGRLGYVAVWRAWLRKFPARDVDRAFHLLDAVGLGDFATQRADQLSGGQRQRVGIARALMQEPELVLADEPTSSLDPKTSVEIMELIARRTAEGGIPAIVNIHNVDLARRFADRIIGMSKGEIVFDGPPQALQDTHLLQIYGGEGWLQ